MREEKTIVYSYNKDTKTYTVNYKEMQKINRQLKERFTLRQENKQLQNNWNELKEWLEEGIEEQERIWRQREIIYSYKNVLDEMQELEANNE